MSNAETIKNWIESNFSWLPEREKVAMYIKMTASQKDKGARPGYDTATWRYADGTPVRRQSFLFLWADPNAPDTEVAEIARQKAGKGALQSHLEVVKRHRWIELTSSYRTINTRCYE